LEAALLANMLNRIRTDAPRSRYSTG